MVKKFESINMVELAVKVEKKAMEKIIENENNLLRDMHDRLCREIIRLNKEIIRLNKRKGK
jgi:hypothetical protein